MRGGGGGGDFETLFCFIPMEYRSGHKRVKVRERVGVARTCRDDIDDVYTWLVNQVCNTLKCFTLVHCKGLDL